MDVNYALGNESNIIKGERYRFTVITDRFIRMEYAEDGQFEDLPSQTFLIRDIGSSTFTYTEENGVLSIHTSFLELIYQVNQPFEVATLQVTYLPNKKLWKYGAFENGNLMGTARTLDDVNGELQLERGLFSTDGYVVLYDHERLLIKDDFVVKRKPNTSDVYFFAYGDAYEEGLRVFYQTSGRTPLIPRYALGNWWSRYWEYSENELKELILDFEKRDIPLSVCIIDMDWHKVHIDAKYGSGWTGYSWNKELFPNPKEMLDWLSQKGLAKSLNLHPADGVRGHEDMYLEMAKFMGVDYQKEEPILFDVTNRKFMEAYFKFLHHPFETMGVDFWWIDWQQGTTSDLEGLDPLWMLNHRHYKDLNRDGTKRGFTFSRYAKIGSHRYPVGFSGDTHVTWESLQFQPFFTTNASYVGYGWWSHDIGGHHKGYENRELYIRWVQYGVFSPIFRFHSTKNYFHKREPWRWDHEIESIATMFLRLRHELIPYIYSMARINEQYGLPLIRPMSFINHKTNNKNQYLFGSELLVGSITNERDTILNRSIVTVYLPEGTYYDFFTGTHYEGGKTYTLYPSLDEYPVFAKAGAIIPLSTLKKRNQIENPEELHLKLFPGNNTFALYEDDGVTSNYLEGEFVETSIHLELKNNILSVNIAAPKGALHLIPQNRRYKVEIMGYNNKTIFFEGLLEHKIDIILKQPILLDKNKLITEILLDANMDNHPKEWIGYTSHSNHQKRGIIHENISINEKIQKIQNLKIDSRIKNCVVDILKR